MTFEEATPRILSYCEYWSRQTKGRIEAEDFFGNIWLAYKGDLSSFNRNWGFLYRAVNQRCLNFTQLIGNNPKSNTVLLDESYYESDRLTGQQVFDNQDEFAYLIKCLTPEERRVMKMIVLGHLTKKQVAISHHTIRYKIHDIYHKAIGKIRRKHGEMLGLTQEEMV